MKYANLTTYQAAYRTRHEAEQAARELCEQGHQAQVVDSRQYTDDPGGFRWIVVDERNIR